MAATLAPHKTKIVCTIGPATDKPAILTRMIRAGMSVARLNLAHGDLHRHAATIARLRKASAQVNRPVAILADLPGPKLRIGKLSPDPPRLCHGQRFILTGTSKNPSFPRRRESSALIFLGSRFRGNDGSRVFRGALTTESVHGFPQRRLYPAQGARHCRTAKDLLTRLDYADKDHALIHPNPDIVFTYAEAHLDNGMIAP